MKRTVVGLLSVACLCGSLALLAEESAPDGAGRGFPPREGQAGRGGRGRMRMDPARNPMIRRLAAEAQLKAQAPEEYAAAVKAQAAAAQAWRAAAAKAKVTLPEDSADQLQQIREKAPAEYEELLKLAGSDPKEALRKWRAAAEKAGVKLMMFRGAPDGGMRPGAGREAPEPGSRRMSRVPFDKLRKSFPAEMAKYDEWKQSDPEKARELLRDLLRKTQQQERKDK